jgi:hypothetical protein
MSWFLDNRRTKLGQHQALSRRWVQMHNHMPSINRLTNQARTLFMIGISAVLVLSISASVSLSNAHAQSYSGRSSDANNSSTSPSYGTNRPLSGTAPAPARPLSGFEQQGVSGIRPGQPGNPLPSAQSGGKDGKSGSNSSTNKLAPGQKGFVQGQDSKSGDRSAKGKNGFGKDASGKDQSGKDFNAKDAANGSAGLACLNCATILQVRTVRMKPNPSWMLNSDARATETANSHNSELPSRYQGSSIGTTGNRSIINPDGAGAQFGKRMYEVTLMMDSGLTRKVHLDMMPAYNLGSKVRVTGNRLLPR